MRQLNLIDQSLSSSVQKSDALNHLIEENTGSVTEIIINSDSAIQPVHLLPLLNQISIDERWLMWIAEAQHSSPSLDRRWVQALGVKEDQVAHIKCHNNMLEVSRKALAAGTGHLIIEWQDDLTTEQYELLQTAANKGNSHALIIRRR